MGCGQFGVTGHSWGRLPPTSCMGYAPPTRCGLAGPCMGLPIPRALSTQAGRSLWTPSTRKNDHAATPNHRNARASRAAGDADGACVAGDPALNIYH